MRPHKSPRSRLQPADPVGIHAPIDLTGTTPLGWSDKRANKSAAASECKFIACSPRPASVPIKFASDIQSELFSPGDASVLPHTPKAGRSGTVKKTKIVRVEPALPPHEEESAVVEVSSSHLSEHRSNDYVISFGFSEAGGWRHEMEDRIVAITALFDGMSPNSLFADVNLWSLFAVFDGHQGSFSSSFVSTNIAPVLRQKYLELSIDNVQKYESRQKFLEELLRKTCLETDKMLSEQARMAISFSASGKVVLQDYSGTTCVLCLVTTEEIAVANIGDSRAVLGVKHDKNKRIEPISLSDDRLRRSDEPEVELDWRAIALSHDHKPYLAEEKVRIEAAGMRYESIYSVYLLKLHDLCRVGKVNDDVYEIISQNVVKEQKLRMSRSLGDFSFKQCRFESGDLFPPEQQGVTANPDVIIWKRNLGYTVRFMYDLGSIIY